MHETKANSYNIRKFKKVVNKYGEKLNKRETYREKGFVQERQTK